MLAGAAKGKKGSEGGGRQSKITDVNTGRLFGLKYELVCHFKLAVDMVGGGIREFVDRPAFLERELMGTGRLEFTTVQWTSALNPFREHLTYFYKVK